MKKLLLALITIVIIVTAARSRAALGEKEEQCLTRYRERLDRRYDDIYHAQNTVCSYRDVVVVFNRKDVAIELTFTFNKRPTDAQINARLGEAGQTWTKVRPPLGSAMEKPKEVWKANDGSVADLVNVAGFGGGYWLTLRSAERLQQIAEKEASRSANR